MHFFPGHRFHLPILIRDARVIPPPSTYQPPYQRFLPAVLAYPAPLYAQIGQLAMTVISAMDPERCGRYPPALVFAPMSLAVWK